MQAHVSNFGLTENAQNLLFVHRITKVIHPNLVARQAMSERSLGSSH